jgi:hypothetical protein
MILFATRFNLEKNTTGFRWFCLANALSIEIAFAVFGFFQSRTLENNGEHNNSLDRTRNSIAFNLWC